LALQYIIKLKANPSNPAYSSVYQPNCTVLFDAKPNTIPALSLRLHQAVAESGINLNSIALQSLPSLPPWLLQPSVFDYTLYNMGTKLYTSPDLYLSIYHELISKKYEDYAKIFTDGSSQKSAVAAAAVMVNKVLVKRLSDHASTFSLEAQAILLALNIISQSSNNTSLSYQIPSPVRKP
jgi:hypothetical protein